MENTIQGNNNNKQGQYQNTRMPEAEIKGSKTKQNSRRQLNGK